MASSGEVPVSEDEGGVGGRARQEASSYGALALVLAAGSAERAEGGGVGAAFGREVAAEAEHVRPCAKAELFEPRGSLPRRRHSAICRRA